MKLNETKTKSIAEIMVLDKFWVNSDIFGIKKHLLKLGKSMMTSKQLMESNQNQTKPNKNEKI